jgi:hypothetical protein
MTFDGNEGGPISIDVASAMTAEYRRLNPNATRAHFFGRKRIEELLKLDNAMGIRMYYGINPTTGAKELVLAAADAAGDDIMTLLMDISKPCPGYPSRNNSLNSDQ